MSRNGKIARLPRVVRDELNRRLEDGEQGARLVEWLNAREDVQAVLPPSPRLRRAGKAEWDGRPINEATGLTFRPSTRTIPSSHT